MSSLSFKLNNNIQSNSKTAFFYPGIYQFVNSEAFPSLW